MIFIVRSDPLMFIFLDSSSLGTSPDAQHPDDECDLAFSLLGLASSVW